jgi:hypothetical protein
VFGDRAFPAVYFGNRYFAPGGAAAPEPETAPAVQPTGGWMSPPGLGRHETAEMRHRERVRLGIEQAQQRAIDRAAVRIAATAPHGGLLAPAAVLAAPAFDRLLAALQPTEGQAMTLVEAVLARLAWMQAEADDEEAIVRLMMEMD